MALPAQWTGSEPAEIANSLLEALLGMLRLGFVFVRLYDPEDGRPIETMRVAESPQGEDVNLSVAAAFFGPRGEIGALIAGSPRSDFPTPLERLVLDVAASQAGLALLQGRCLRDTDRNSRLLVDSIPGLVALLIPADVDDRKRAEEELKRSEAFLLEGQRLARIGNFAWRTARRTMDAMDDVRDRPRHLLIRTEREDPDGMRLTVRDAGVGLPPEHLNSLFDPFYSTKRRGMRFGLFVSRSIVETHHGQLWAKPNDGEPGATFSFSIPRAAEDIPDAALALRTS